MKNLEKIEKTFKQLQKADWFCNIGKKESELVIVLPSWTDTLDVIKSAKWEDFTLEQANQIGDKVIKESKDRYNHWNDVVLAMKPYIINLVQEKSKSFIGLYGQDAVFKRVVEWDMIHLAIEIEYSDLCGLGFFTNQSHWYMAGHFPCGWAGEYPSGKAIIY